MNLETRKRISRLNDNTFSLLEFFQDIAAVSRLYRVCFYISYACGTRTKDSISILVMLVWDRNRIFSLHCDFYSFICFLLALHLILILSLPVTLEKVNTKVPQQVIFQVPTFQKHTYEVTAPFQLYKILHHKCNVSHRN